MIEILIQNASMPMALMIIFTAILSLIVLVVGAYHVADRILFWGDRMLFKRRQKKMRKHLDRACVVTFKPN